MPCVKPPYPSTPDIRPSLSSTHTAFQCLADLGIRPPHNSDYVYIIQSGVSFNSGIDSTVRTNMYINPSYHERSLFKDGSLWVQLQSKIVSPI